jgi:hypothetical protein
MKFFSIILKDIALGLSFKIFSEEIVGISLVSFCIWVNFNTSLHIHKGISQGFCEILSFNLGLIISKELLDISIVLTLSIILCYTKECFGMFVKIRVLFDFIRHIQWLI